MATEWPIDRIKPGQRHRKVLGDIDNLAASIEAIGLLHPVVVNKDGTLIAGERRIAAFRKLGRTHVPVNVIDIEAIAKGERDENVCRKDFAPTEAVEIADAVREEEERLARERMIAAHASPEKFSELDAGESRAKAAKATGKSFKTIEKAREVIKAADTDPDLFGDLVDQMDETGKVDGAFREMKRREAQQKVEAQRQQDPDRGVIKRGTVWDLLDSVADESVDLLLTDPPYSTDVPNIGEFSRWLECAVQKLKPTGQGYVCIGSYPVELLAYLDTVRRAGWIDRTQVLVWTYRNTLGPAPSDQYKTNWQAILYLRGEDAPPLDCPVMTEQFSVHDINAPDGRLGGRYHAWQKPDDLADRFVRHASKPGDFVLDPFAGTGTFVLKAAELGRQAIGFEVNEEMVKIATKRGCSIES